MNTFECDKNKARTNYRKHGVKLTEAGRAFNSHYVVTGHAPQPLLDEERNLSITTLSDGRGGVIIWTPRNGHVRIISVRRARKQEKEQLYGYFRRFQSSPQHPG